MVRLVSCELESRVLSTSFPGSLERGETLVGSGHMLHVLHVLLSSLAPGVKMRDPGNEVGVLYGTDYLLRLMALILKAIFFESSLI